MLKIIFHNFILLNISCLPYSHKKNIPHKNSISVCLKYTAYLPESFRIFEKLKNRHSDLLRLLKQCGVQKIVQYLVIA